MLDREDPGKIPAAVLALLVHLLFFVFLVFGVSWRSQEPAAVQVDLWSSLPAAAPRAPLEPRQSPRPEPKPEPRPEPKPAKAEPQPSKAEIELKAKEAKRKEKLKQEEIRRKEQQEKQKREQALKAEQAKASEAARQQREALDAAARTQATAQARVIGDYKDRINAKIKRFINNQPCLPLVDPEVRYSVTLMPTGQLLMEPKLVKSSGNATCDQAIERAIRRAEPLPLPPDPALFREFRELSLVFEPNSK